MLDDFFCVFWSRLVFFFSPLLVITHWSLNLMIFSFLFLELYHESSPCNGSLLLERYRSKNTNPRIFSYSLVIFHLSASSYSPSLSLERPEEEKEGEEDVSHKQQSDWTPELSNLPPLNPNPSRRNMAIRSQHHRLRQVPRPTHHCRRRLPHGRLPRRPRGRLLPRLLPPLALPPRNVLAHRPSILLHNLRIRRHPQGRWRDCFWERIQGVSIGGLLELAAEEGQ